MPLKNISQKRWLKGLNAAFGLLSQPSNIVSRISNMLWTRRGSAVTCDGTSILSAYTGAVTIHPGIGSFLEIFLYQPVGKAAVYFGLFKYSLATLGPPTGFTAIDGGAGGLLSAGAYQWAVTALDGAGGESNGTAPITVTLLVSHKGSLNWVNPTFSNGTNVYRTKAGGITFYKIATLAAGVATYLDNIPDSALVTPSPIPVSDTTSYTALTALPAGTWSTANIAFLFPPDAYNVTGNPLGGQSGNTDSLPIILQFANLIFLALGNGIIPYTSDGVTTIPITNTFIAAYPGWQAATVYVVGDQIFFTIAGSNYLFTTTQSGTSGGAAPAFSATLGSTVTDNQIIWKNSGKISSSPAPRGAAHIEIYAGSIWVANTAPSLSADQLDGPSALRMSDANNPNSWNPLNAAQIARDNGQQITGLKTFSVAEAGIPTTENLVVFKDFSTFIVQGVFGSSNFAIQQAQTDLGCVAARSIQFVPGFGIVRLTHLGFAVFDGVRDRIVSEEIRPYLFGDDILEITPMDWAFSWNCKAGQTADPPMYVCAVPLSTTPIGVLPATIAVHFIPFGGTQPIPAGNYYCKLFMTDTSGNVFVSPEFGPLNVSLTFGFQISLPSIPPNASKYTFFYGTTPGGENLFINYTPTQMAAALPGGLFIVRSLGVAGNPAVNNGLTRIFTYDLVLKAWSIVDLPFPINVLKQFRQPKTIPTTLMAGFLDGATRQWQAHDANWDAGAVNAGAPDNLIHWLLRSSEVYSEGATEQIFFDALAIRGRSSDASFYSGGISVIETYNGQDMPAGPSVVERFPSSNQFDARFSQQETAENFHVTLTGQGQVELDSIDHEVVAKPLGPAGRVIS